MILDAAPAGYLKQQDIPLVIVSHDREFLDQLCTKIVETEFGKATTYKGNYTQYVSAKAEKLAQQWAAYEKQQKEMARQVGLAPACFPDEVVIGQSCADPALASMCLCGSCSETRSIESEPL